ncbi:MAG: hypothetical protein HKL82_08795 [Acidimicrobiaceae bacterium]|nr:hypothetical protein [Acidimicrobiaceae bacterium]
MSNDSRAIVAIVAAALLTVGVSVCLAALGYPLAAFIIGSLMVVIAALLISCLFVGWPLDFRERTTILDPRRQLLKDRLAVFADEAALELQKVYKHRDPQGSQASFSNWRERVEQLLRSAVEPAEVVLFLDGAHDEPEVRPSVPEAELWDTYGKRLRRMLDHFDRVKIKDDWQA